MEAPPRRDVNGARDANGSITMTRCTRPHLGGYGDRVEVDLTAPLARLSFNLR